MIYLKIGLKQLVTKVRYLSVNIKFQMLISIHRILYYLCLSCMYLYIYLHLLVFVFLFTFTNVNNLSIDFTSSLVSVAAEISEGRSVEII